MFARTAAVATALFAAVVCSAAAPAKDAGVVKVKMVTSMGTIELELDKAKAPLSVDNFVAYAKAGFYTGTVFHRVIPGFMIQGGGFDQKYNKKDVKAPIKNESGNGLSNVRGSIAMARTSDPDSATSQFYINHVDNKNLDAARYAVFGKVTAGLDVVDKIAAVPTGVCAGMPNCPTSPVIIQSVTVQ